MMKFLTFGFPVALLVAWTVAWFVWVRPWLKRYQAVAGILDEIETAEKSGLAWVWLKLKGAWHVIALGVSSLVLGAKGLIQALFGLDPSALQPFQDSTIWKAVLQDEMAIRAAAIALFASALLTLKNKVKDISTEPAKPTPPQNGA